MTAEMPPEITTYEELVEWEYQWKRKMRADQEAALRLFIEEILAAYPTDEQAAVLAKKLLLRGSL